MQYNTSTPAPPATHFWIDHHWIQSTEGTWKPSGWFRLKTSPSSWKKNIDCYNGSTEEGTRIIQYDQNDDLNQFWYFERVDTTGNSKILSWNLVDSGKHLDVQIDGSYKNLVKDAMAMWNSYKSGVIRLDSLINIEDVRVLDAADTCTVNSYWLGSTNPSTREIKLNKSTLNFFNNPGFIRKTAAHELGHALGIDHWDSVADMAYANKGDVMISGPYCIPNIGYRDKISYDRAYANY